MAKFKRRISYDISDNRFQYLMLVFFIVVGITAGTFTVSHMEPGEKTALTGYTDMLLFAVKYQSVDYFSVFVHAFLQDTLLFGIITAFSMLIIGLLVICAVMIMKGFFVGFTIGVFALNFGISGFAAIIFCVIIPNIILIPCICKAGALGFNNSIMVLKNRRVPSTAKDRIVGARPHFRKMVTVYLFSMLGVLLETLITPLLLKII